MPTKKRNRVFFDPALLGDVPVDRASDPLPDPGNRCHPVGSDLEHIGKHDRAYGFRIRDGGCVEDNDVFHGALEGVPYGKNTDEDMAWLEGDPVQDPIDLEEKCAVGEDDSLWFAVVPDV
jgi:hypothetical protein